MNQFTTIKQVISHYNKLKGKTIKEIYEKALNDYPDILLNVNNKGIVGQVFEASIGQKPNSNPNPDIENLALELKVLPLRKVGQSLQPKERSKIKSINYNSIVDEEWNTSEVKNKINNVLFFVYEQPTGVKFSELDKQKFEGVLHFDLNSNDLSGDLSQIKKDWELIQSVVKREEADLLSESLTDFLGASTSGTGLQVKYGNGKSAKQRSYSFKHSYLKYFYLKNKNKLKETGKSVSSIIDILQDKLVGKSLLSLSLDYELNFEYECKSGFKNLINNILKVEKGKLPSELVKENLSIKTIPISKEGVVFEAMSFPKFSLVDLEYEKWNVLDNEEEEEAVFKNIISDGFVFITLEKQKIKYFDDKENKNKYKFNLWKDWIIKDVFIWKPTENDLKGIEKEWNIYKQFIVNNQLQITPKVTKKGNIINNNNLPKYSETEYIHIRPHTMKASNLDLPFKDKYKKAISWQSFWLNKNFIEKIVEEYRNK
ncbi:MutH/Sau3AI family endonuclease [Myroides odoratimimus]|uniref:MutH/Sau3AI family endonuclease n=1 Tax=Myroides odoratimimus TaxID=76832 RepID=UPI003D2F98AE